MTPADLLGASLIVLAAWLYANAEAVVRQVRWWAKGGGA